MRVVPWLGLVCASLLVCSAALAQPASSAREHFARGLQLAQLGEFDSAAVSFEEAYRLSPHYAVQFNLGQTYAALGKPIEAVRAFERYLEAGGQKIKPERQAEVRQLILLNKKRVGYVSFEVEPPEAELRIDGRALADSLRAPTGLAIGVHGVTGTLMGFLPFVGSVKVEAQKTVSFKVKLERAPGSDVAAATHVSVGQVAVDSALPELKVSFDGVAIERLGDNAFLAPPGRYPIRCERDGYEPIDAQIDVVENEVVRIACNLRPRSRLQPSEAGFVSFSIDQPGAEVWIDGRRVATSTRLPKGIHSARVHRWGFIDWTQPITVRPGFPETITVQLKPTPERALEIAQANSKRRSYAYVIGGAGIALLGTSVALYATNDQRYQSWAEQRDSVSREIRAQNYSEDLSARARDVRVTAVSIQRQDDAALGAAVVGGVLLGYAVISWLSAR